MDLKDRTVVLTGASRGIGVAIARDLASAGCDLVLVARDGKRLADVASALPGRVRIVSADVSTEAGRAAVLAVGDIDVLVNNAGIEIAVALHDQTPEEIEAQFAVNLVAPTLLTRAVLPGMIARKRGAVVMVSSMSGKSPTPYNAVYTATKHGLVGFSASLRIELRDLGVHAGVVCPGFVDEAGMFHDLGVPAPAAMRAVPLQAVVAATLRAVDGGVEELVTPAPMRPLLALNQLFPRLAGPVLSGLGILKVLEERAKVVAARRGG